MYDNAQKDVRWTPGSPVRCVSRQTIRLNRATILGRMKELLQQVDPDYYRCVQLLIVHAELEQLRRWRAEVTRSRKTLLGSADGSAPGALRDQTRTVSA